MSPEAILGIAASLIPWSNHNQTPRNIYQTNMGKQQIGIHNVMWFHDFTSFRRLSFPCPPLVDTRTSEMLNTDRRGGSGMNVEVAVIAHTKTEEDAFVVKKSFVEYGGFRYVQYITKTLTVTSQADFTEVLGFPSLTSSDNPNLYHGISPNGLPYIGAYLRPRDAVIGKIRNISFNKPRTSELDMRTNQTMFMAIDEEGIVDSIMITGPNGCLTVNVRIRSTRCPLVGDKFAPRNAQKGTIGRIVPDEEMPYSLETGRSPDFIINSHQIPSRMTMAYIMELIAGRSASLTGSRVDASSFGKFDADTFYQTLDAHGFSGVSTETFISGRTGERLEGRIYVGTAFFSSLKHLVLNKIRARGTGPVKDSTRQPVAGKDTHRGLRFGEMEKDNTYSHGASEITLQLLSAHSDQYSPIYCKQCRIPAISSPNGNYRCLLCKNANFGRLVCPFSFTYVGDILAAMGILLRPGLEDSDEYKKRLYNLQRCENLEEVNPEEAAREEEELLRQEEEYLQEEEEENQRPVDSRTTEISKTPYLELLLN